MQKWLKFWQQSCLPENVLNYHWKSIFRSGKSIFFFQTIRQTTDNILCQDWYWIIFACFFSTLIICIKMNLKNFFGTKFGYVNLGSIRTILNKNWSKESAQMNIIGLAAYLHSLLTDSFFLVFFFGLLMFWWITSPILSMKLTQDSWAVYYKAYMQFGSATFSHLNFQNNNKFFINISCSFSLQ